MQGKLILCFYVGVGNMDQADVPQYIEEVKKSNAHLFTDNGIAAFLVPITGPNSRIECVNPVLVTDQEAKDTFNEALKRLNQVIGALEKQENNEKAEQIEDQEVTSSKQS